ncbi:isopentenyl-diphosphate Delta-isomerase [Pedobacter immunditicola]|uniref:isopentenyl-diphosphate Delta-isomerase n=1 Tax=Pedobacter immunditicola TaxID=3133440 RepID=UPI003097271A
MEERVILVNQDDQEMGTMEKQEAHVSGLLHRAFSIFIFNSKGELLLQQRALDKYHSPGLWTNTCCSHPRPGEDTLAAANRRLQEEMGMQTELQYGFNFTYKANFGNHLIEHEFDHVFFGSSDLLPLANPAEVAAFKYLSLAELEQDLIKNPEHYSAWLNICFPKVVDFKHKIYGTLGS